MPGPIIDTGFDEALSRGLSLGLQAQHLALEREHLARQAAYQNAMLSARLDNWQNLSDARNRGLDIRSGELDRHNRKDAQDQATDTALYGGGEPSGGRGLFELQGGDLNLGPPDLSTPAFSDAGIEHGPSVAPTADGGDLPGLSGGPAAAPGVLPTPGAGGLPPIPAGLHGPALRQIAAARYKTQIADSMDLTTVGNFTKQVDGWHQMVESGKIDAGRAQRQIENLYNKLTPKQRVMVDPSAMGPLGADPDQLAQGYQAAGMPAAAARAAANHEAMTGRAMPGAARLLPKAGGASPEAMEARFSAMVDAAGGEAAFDPQHLAFIHDKMSHGEPVPSREFQLALKLRGSGPGAIAAAKIEHADAQSEYMKALGALESAQSLPGMAASPELQEHVDQLRNRRDAAKQALVRLHMDSDKAAATAPAAPTPQPAVATLAPAQMQGVFERARQMFIDNHQGREPGPGDKEEMRALMQGFGAGGGGQQ